MQTQIRRYQNTVLREDGYKVYVVQHPLAKAELQKAVEKIGDDKGKDWSCLKFYQYPNAISLMDGLATSEVFETKEAAEDIEQAIIKAAGTL